MVHQTDAEEGQQELLEMLWQHMEEGRELPGGCPGERERRLFEQRGWLVPGKIELTAEGRRFASGAIRKHRLAERLLADILGSQVDLAEEHACRLEHSLVHGLDDRVCTFLGHPRVCPHGHRIPEGECCRQATQSVSAAIVSLARLKDGEEATIAYLANPGEDDLQKFLAMGIHPGDTVILLRRSPSFVFRSGNSQFAIDRELASQVFVRRR